MSRTSTPCRLCDNFVAKTCTLNLKFVHNQKGTCASFKEKNSEDKPKAHAGEGVLGFFWP